MLLLHQPFLELENGPVFVFKDVLVQSLFSLCLGHYYLELIDLVLRIGLCFFLSLRTFVVATFEIFDFLLVVSQIFFELLASSLFLKFLDLQLLSRPLYSERFLP
jgi:hypothetical protein